MAKIALIALNNINRYPAMFYIAEKLSRDGHDVTLISRENPENLSKNISFKWLEIKKSSFATKRIPILKGGSLEILIQIFKLNPEWVIGQHQYAIIGIIYKLFFSKKNISVGAYFSDYIENNFNSSILKFFSSYIDLYIDVCDLRVEWRKKDWPRLTCKTFVIRQATPKSDNTEIESHKGPTKIIFTGSDYGAGMQWSILVEFINKLCENGILFDWYLPGPDTVREKAKKISNSENFKVCNPINKVELLSIERNYDFGLFWAPYSSDTEKISRSIYTSAASNKICEYQSSGIGIIHTGNPGLFYLPKNATLSIDPWNIKKSTEILIKALKCRNTVEDIRKKSYQYHLETMNSEEQISPLSKYIFG